jgi:nucleoside-diphosphate-sugar epimerase
LTESPGTRRKRVLVAGAGGAIGGAVCRELAVDHDVVALVGSGLRAGAAGADPSIEWRACEAFSRRDVEAAIAGCDYIVYLVHTRMATARLDQVACEDMDLLIADNVARAASRHGVRQIVYLGGWIPAGEDGSGLAERRREVMEALSFYGTPVTTLRAGLVVAPGSSTLRLLASAATRLPFVLVPQWAMTRKQPIAVGDLIRGIRYCLGNEATYDQHFEVGGPVTLDFFDLLRHAAEVLQKTPTMVKVPFFPRRLYAGYLRLLDRQAHPELVQRVVESLPHDVIVGDNPVQRHIARGATRPREIVEPLVRQLDGRLPANPRDAVGDQYRSLLRASREVRSIQRVALPRGRNAAWVADHYFDWLSRLIRPLLYCEIDAGGSCRVKARWPRLLLLELTLQASDSTADRRLYGITGGLLARGTGGGRARLEFRDVLGGRNTIIAIHDFAPNLPWLFYRATQATIHLAVMRGFQRHMARLANTSTGAPGDESTPP